jgi:hypothetical protein
MGALGGKVFGDFFGPLWKLCDRCGLSEIEPEDPELPIGI